jgi:hypothetical protein
MEIETQNSIELTYTPKQDLMFFHIPDGTKYQIVTKGRRFGATRGAAHACIEWALEGQHILWGDTVNTNIDRYYERYFLPALKNTSIKYQYQKQAKQLTIHNGYIDFRSADRPENWEGFGYDKIFLNEAGIILKNRYLYTNAVLPMLMDNPESLLIAAGVPKGKIDRDKEEHAFYTLFKAAKNKSPKYNLLEFSSYDNPLMPQEEIHELEKEIRRMSPEMVEQEIYGKFVDGVTATLWTADMIRQVERLPELKRIVIGNDPSGSVEGDEVGIIGAGIDYRDNIYILSDRSGHYTPLQWGNITVKEYKHLKADCVVAERNYGGDMVKANILNVDRLVRVKDVVASRSKQIRAEPVVSLYEQGKVFHVQGLHKLENEMLTWTPGIGKSPNRVDGLVWAITELVGGGSSNTEDLQGMFF